MTTECDQLDTYLFGDLPFATATRFEQHLTVCADCRKAVAQQHWIDGLLQSDVVASLEPVPASLTTPRTLDVRRRRQNARYVASLAVAATLLIAVFGWKFRMSREENAASPTNRQTARNEESLHDATQVLADVPAGIHQTQFVNSSDSIAVQIESDDENVSIVQLLPTTQTDRRVRRELTLRALELELNGG